MSYSINSLLTIDINNLDLFTTPKKSKKQYPRKEKRDKSRRNYQPTAKNHPSIRQKFEELLTVMKETKDSTETKLTIC
jgi:hypothetical protein